MGLTWGQQMKKWKIALVGAGYMASEHAKAFASLPNVTLVGSDAKAFACSLAM